jgi:hypothetical protein
MPKIFSAHHSQPSFPGFDLPQQNWFKMPSMWTDITADISSIAELKVIEYVLKHTWGYQEYGIKKRITIDEFRYGRKRQDGSRLDRGTGLSKQSVINGIKAAVGDGLLAEEVDDRDRARVKKYYFLRMKQAEQSDSDAGGVKNLDADVKVLDTGVKSLDTKGQEFGHRTEKDTLERNQQQTTPKKNGDSSSESRDAAAILIEKGIDKKVAYHLAGKYKRQRIEDNLDWFEWKQANEPNSIKTNPAGLLRTAIEKDFAAEEHKGFQTRRQKVASSLEKKQRLQAREKLVKAHERQQATILQQKEAERLKRLDKLREQYHTSEREMKLWSQVLKTFKEQISRASFNIYLASSTLLSLREGKALVAVPNRFVQGWLEDHLLSEIQQVLSDLLKGQTVTVLCLRLDKLNDES